MDDSSHPARKTRGRVGSTRELKHRESPSLSAHVECARHQRDEETAVPGLADPRVEAGRRDVQGDEANFPPVPGRVRESPDPG